MSSAKLCIPDWRESDMPRPSIDILLNEGGIRRVSLVVAGSGYGKTTSVAAWASQQKRKGVRVSWFSLDTQDNDTFRFMSYLLSSLSMGVEGLYDDVINRMLSPHKPPLEWVISECIDRLDVQQEPQKMVLIIDDFHFINEKAILLAMNQLITYCPSQLSIVLISRETPLLPVARYRSKGWLSEVGVSDLALSPMESRAFMLDKMAVDPLLMNDLVMEQFIERTEGWVTGLQLTALSIQTVLKTKGQAVAMREAKKHVELALSGNHALVMSYLTEVIFDQLSEDEKILLMVTSITSQCNMALAHQLMLATGDFLGVSEGDAFRIVLKLIEGFKKKNLMIVLLGPNKEWFRYHHLLSDFLRSHLELWLATPQIKARGLTLNTLHKVASHYFIEQDMALEALYHGIHSGDIDYTAGLLLSGPIPLLYRGATDMGLKWLESLPTHELDQRPWLWLMIASSDFYLGKTANLVFRLNQTEKAMRLHLNTDLVQFNKLESHIASIRAVHFATQHQFEQAIQNGQLALEVSDSFNFGVRCTSLWVLGYSNLNLRNYEKAYDFLMESKMMSQQYGHVLIWLMATLSLGKLKQEAFKYDEAIIIYEEVLGYKAHKSYPVTCDLYIELATIYYHQGKFDQAHLMLEDALNLVDNIDKTDRKFRCHLLKAKLFMVDAAYTNATDALESAEHELKSNNYLHRNEELNFEKGRLLLCQGNLYGVEVLLAFSNSQRLEARLNYFKGNGRLAIQRLELLIQSETEQKCYEFLVDDLVILALSYYTYGNLQKAIHSLYRALDLAFQNQYMIPFLEAGEVLLSLIDKSGLEALNLRLIKTIRSALEPKIEKSQNPLVEALTPREMDVLRLVSEGLSNEEIAQQLYLATSSIKGINQRIFAKLQVYRRTEAVAKAKRLGWFT